jgi:hypothetical protein
MPGIMMFILPAAIMKNGEQFNYSDIRTGITG